MSTLRLPGTELYYEVAGSGVPVVLLHGMGLDARMWDDQFEALADVAQVARLDFRGFGRSPRDPAVAYSHASDVWALADHLGWQDALLVGLSMGGTIALETVLARPDRVRALVLLDAFIDGVPLDESTKATITALFAAAASGDRDRAREVWLGADIFAPARRDAQLDRRLGEMVADFSCADWFGEDPHEPRPKLYPRLPDIMSPTTVIVGELDTQGFLDMADALGSRIPGARMVVVPRAGHMVNMEAPAEVNAVLCDVIAGTA